MMMTSAFVSATGAKLLSKLGKERTNVRNGPAVCKSSARLQHPDSTDSSSSTGQPSISRRSLLRNKILPLILAGLSPLYPSLAAAGTETSSSAVDTEKALQELRDVTGLQDLAFEYTNRFDFPQAEILWTKIIGLNDTNAGAYSNRGNCRTSQGKFSEAVTDFNQAIKLSSEEPDSYLGKGVALEGLHEYREALQAYETSNAKSVARYQTDDVVALNNMGNAHGALGEWKDAFLLYKRAADMDSRFVFALANESLALFQLGGDDEGAERKMAFLVRKYPKFADMHAAVAMVEWEKGMRSKAEDEWYKAVENDARYENTSWVRDIRRWPPRLITILENFRGISP